MAIINGNNSSETLSGSQDPDTIDGAGGADSVSGLGGDDMLRGAEGNDTLVGGTGDDTLIGGEGSDEVRYAGVQAGYRVQALADGGLQVVDVDTADGNDGSDRLESVERLVFADASFGVGVISTGDRSVNSTTADNQYNASSVRLSSGGYVTVWQSPDGSGSGIFGQRFDAQGTRVGGEFRVNSSTTGTQSLSDDEVALNAVAAQADGGFVVTWRSDSSDNNSWGVVAQRFSATGEPQGSEIKVNTTTVAEQRDPGVAVLADGKFVVVWMDLNRQDAGEGKDTSEWGVYGQLFDAQGVRVGSEFLVNTEVNGNQYWPHVSALTGGGFVVSWRDDNGADARAQRFDSSGVKQGAAFALNTYGAGGGNWQYHAATVGLPDGGFVAVWQSDDQDGSGRGVYLQRFGADGSKVGAETRVNTTISDHQVAPQIDARADGSFVVAWASNNQDGQGWGIYVQRFDASGARLGEELRVNEATSGDQYNPDVVALANGRFVVTWETTSGQSDGSGYGVFSRLFDPVTGFNSLSFTGGDGNDRIVQAYADVIDGGLGADTMQGGSGNTVYVVDQLGDVVIEAGSGGTDEIRTVLGYTLPAEVENLTLTGSGASTGLGNALANTITGNGEANSLSGLGGDDTLRGAGGNDTLVGGAGNDVLDGGAGINTVVYSGGRSDYQIPTAINLNADGFVVRVTPDAVLAGVSDGVDSLSNVQRLVFEGESDPDFKTIVLDDYSNAPDPGNPQVEYGKTYRGIRNFTGDTDWFRLATVAGDSLHVEFTRPGYIGQLSLSQGASVGVHSNDGAFGVTISQTGVQDLSFSEGTNYWGNGWANNGGSPYSYSFTLRRNWSGTDASESMAGAGRYERLLAGAGNDTVVAGSTSDILDGGSGNDVLTGGGGNDTIEGGPGVNTAVFSGNRADYDVAFVGNNAWQVTHRNAGADGVDYVRNAHVLQFSDVVLALDDHVNERETTLTKLGFGQSITGTANYGGDNDWFQFDFRTLGVNKSLRVTLEGGGSGQRFRMIDNDGNELYFKNAQNQDVVWIGQGSWVLTPDRWGPNGEGGTFYGGVASVHLYADGGGDGSSYRLSLSRYLTGTANADNLSPLGGEPAVVKFDEISGLGGNDTLRGSAGSDRFFGDEGDDSLLGEGGDDYLSGGAGRDTVLAGAGNDVLDVSSQGALSDYLDGGEGTDTLQVSADVSLAGATVAGVEVIRSINGGEFSFGANQLLSWGVGRLDNLDLKAAAGVALDASALQGDFGVVGATGADVLRAGPGNNVIRPLAGAATVEAGAGDDTIRFVSALNNGNWQPDQTQAQFLRADASSRTYFLEGRYDGGAGQDALEIQLLTYWVHAWGEGWVRDRPAYSINLSQATIEGIETLRISGDWSSPSAPAFITLTVAQLAGFQRLESVKGVQLVGGGVVDLGILATKGAFSLSYGDALSYTLVGTPAADTLADTSGNDSIDARAGADTISLEQGVDTVLAGAGDDLITVSGKTAVLDVIDGGDGNDTLRITGGDVDLSGAVLRNVERIEANSATLTLTAQQLLDYQGKLSGSAGLVLKMSQSGAVDAKSLSASLIGIRGSVGADSLTGSTRADMLLGDGGDDLIVGGAGADSLDGGAGADSLSGQEGNDRLVSGPGLDTLLGGEGDDTLAITGKAAVLDSIAGGPGNDRLLAQDGQSYVAAQISGVEVLDGAGTVTLNIEQAQSFLEVRGVSIQLSGDYLQSVTLGSTRFLDGARLMLPEVDSVGIGDGSGIVGSKQDDSITGSGHDERIWGGRGDDSLAGGAGADTLIGGPGVDRLLGGAGSDVFFAFAPGEISSWGQQSTSDLIDGGEGDDRLIVEFSNSHSDTRLTIPTSGVLAVEQLSVLNPNRSYLSLPAAYWRGLQRFEVNVNPDRSLWDGLHLEIQADGKNLDLKPILSESKIKQLSVVGDVLDMDASAYSFAPPVNNRDYWNYDNFSLKLDAFRTLTLGAGDDSVIVRNDNDFSISAGAGSDRIELRSSGVLRGSIDGGEGADVLYLQPGQIYDLSELRISRVETIDYSSATVIALDSQLTGATALNFSGNGRKFTKSGNLIKGSVQDDAYDGRGAGSYEGGKGNDSIYAVETAVFSGNQADYDRSWNGNQLTVQHARGSIADGTDTLADVERLQFKDITVTIDDAPNSYQYFTGTASRLRLQSADYGKSVSAAKDYAADVDLFKSVLVPRSPLSLTASTQLGSGYSFEFFDAQSGSQIYFKDITHNWIFGSYTNGMGAEGGYMPVLSNLPYDGGEVIIRATVYGDQSQSYAFTLNYRDDYAGNINTLGAIDPVLGTLRGYIGASDDADWIRVDLVAGTQYRFDLKGLDSGGGTLVDPKLALYRSNGQLLADSATQGAQGAIGRDDAIIIQASETGSYFLGVSDQALGLGTWTLTQQSLDTIAGNVSSLARADWSVSSTFSIPGEVNVLTDRDWFKVWLDKGISYKFRVTGDTLSDPDLSLRSVGGLTLAYDDNGGGLANPSLSFSPADSGWYFLDVGASGNTRKGTYTLAGSTLVDDFPESLSTSGIVPPNGTAVGGIISFPGDADWFKLGLSANTSYVIDLRGAQLQGSSLDPLADPLLIIRDPAGNILSRIDDFEGSLQPKAFFRPSVSGTYVLEARSAFKNAVGAYTLSVVTAPADDVVDALGSEGAQALALGDANALVRTIGIPGDRDVFGVSLESSKVYEIVLTGRSSGAQTLVDPYLRVFDASGQLLEFDNNSAGGNDARIYLVPQSSGTYFLEASAFNDRGMGSYKLAVNLRNLPPDDVPNDLSSNQRLLPGDQFSGTLLTKNDQDWFPIALSAGEDYVFRVRAAPSGNGTLADPFIEVRGANGALLASNDDQLTSVEPALLFTPSSTANYYLVVKAKNGQTDSGSYTLLTRGPDDHGNAKVDATALVLGQASLGSINWAEGAFGVRALNSIGLASDIDEDWFSFSASAGQTLSLTLKPSDGSLLSRPMLEVLDASNRTLAVADGLEHSLGWAITAFRATTAGNYWVRVIDAAGGRGDYSLNVQQGDLVDEDANGPVMLDWEIGSGITMAQHNARIALAGDTDQFTASFLAGHRYRIDVLPLRDGVNAPLPSGSLAMSWQPSGAATATPVTVRGESAVPSLFDFTVFEADTQGLMSFTVKPFESQQTGAYKLRVIDLGAQSADDRPDTTTAYDAAIHGVKVINETLKGTIGKSGDVDLFAVDLTAGNVYDLSLKGFADNLGTLTMGDLRILSANGGLVTSGQYDPGTGRTDLSLAVFSSGRYYLAVSGNESTGMIGSYVVDTRLRGTSVPSPNDIGDDAQSGAVIGSSGSVSSAVEIPGDRDWFRANLAAGKVYVLDVLALGQGAGGGTLSDSELRVLTATGSQLVFDDDSGVGKDSRIEFMPTTSGDYFIEVAGGSEATGSYTLRLRELFGGLADPLKSSQWYLEALGLERLGKALSGAGVKVGVVDAGVDSSHPDLAPRLSAALAYDTEFDTRNGDPKYPPLLGAKDDHGTAVAGLIAAQDNNEKGIVGVAPGVTLASTRVKWTFDQITEALQKQSAFDVSNNSWGATIPFLDNFNSTALTMAYQALREGVTEGRGGKGTVFVFSAGNGAGIGDSSNYHNFQNAREVLTVGAVGADGRAAGFSSPGANVLVASYGINLLTTDRVGAEGYNKSGDFTQFSGTSAAAPTVAGVAALMLEANPNLGYRDVQQILAYAAIHPDTQSWKQNAAGNFNLGGLSFNDVSGFGVVDANQAVRLARTWTQSDGVVNEFADGARVLSNTGDVVLNQAIPDGTGAVLTRKVRIDSALQLEHVELGVDLRHGRLGDLIIDLTAPSGTTSTLMKRPTVSAEYPFGIRGSSFNFLSSPGTSGSSFNFLSVGTGIDGASFNFLSSGADVDGASFNFLKSGVDLDGASFNFLSSAGGADSSVATRLMWDFSSVQFWGEEAAGEWTITVRDVVPGETGVLNGLSLRVYGEASSDNDTYVFTDEGFRTQAQRRLADERGFDRVNAVALTKDTLIDLQPAGQIASQGVSYPLEAWTQIEEAISGFGNDQLIGNNAANRLEGSEGDDTLNGGLGNDTLIGGTGSDVAVYAGKKEEYAVSWNAATRTITVLDQFVVAGATSGSAVDEGVDRLEGIERIVFSDGELSLSQTVGNKPPTATASYFATPVRVPKGIGIDYELPSAAFADSDGSAGGLRLSASAATGVGLPEWLRFDPGSRKFSGVPPVDLQGQIKLLVKAADDFGAETSGVLTLQFGDNQAPRVDAPSQREIQEDAARFNFGITAPVDPENKSVTVTILELPTKGTVVDAQNTPILEGAALAPQALSELHFQAFADQYGSAGRLRYQAQDADGVLAESSVSIFIRAVNDAPRFANKPTTALVNYPMAADLPLELASPSDPESPITKVKVVELPSMGVVRLTGVAGSANGTVAVNQSIELSQLQNLTFRLNENVNGPIGRLGIQATDPEGLSTVWTLSLEVQGESGSNTGTGGADALYGSISADTLYGLGGDDTLAGNAGDDRLLGGSGNDFLFGGAGNDTMDGSSGNDYLDGGTGNDQMAGGPGQDTYIVDSSGDVVIEAISGGAGGKDLVLTSVSLTAPSNVENLQAADQAGAIDLSGNALANMLIGNAAANRLTGGADRDSLYGAGGNDTLDGGSGIDRLTGGSGDDEYVVDSRRDVLIELASDGVETVRSFSSFTLPLNFEHLVLEEGGDFSGGGNSLNNRILGNSGNNLLSGGLGADTLEGGSGNDTYVLSDGEDTIIDTAGNDSVRSSLDVDLRKYPDIEDIELVGIDDVTAYGNARDNRITGNSGDNNLDGGEGVDTLAGGAGSDAFAIESNGPGSISDLVLDFESGSDLLVIDIASFGIDVVKLGLVSSGVVAAGSFVSGAGARALDPNDFFVFNSATGRLYFDADGSGPTAEFELARFVGTPGLQASDLYVVI